MLLKLLPWLLIAGAAAGETAKTIEHKQLSVTPGVSKEHVHAGQKVSLTLDIQLKPSMHVYAPGVSGEYIPIEWIVDGAGDVKFPPSQKLRLEAVGDTLPVFSDAFKLTRDFTVPKATKSGEMVIKGTLKYQACDDRMCYFPQSVPILWTVNVDAP